MPAPTIRVTIDDRELRRIIQNSKGKAVRIVADGVSYGLFQEMGVKSRNVPAHPFMRPAVEAVRPGFQKAFQNTLTLAQAEAVVEKAARDIERGAKARAPVDTGALRNSIHVVARDDPG